MKLVCSSDWHADAVTQGVDRFSEIERGVIASVNHAIDSGADAYLFGGDLADPHNVRSHRASRLAHWAMEELRAAEIYQFWVAGNHDVIEDGTGETVLSSLCNLQDHYCYLFEQPDTFEILGFDVQLIALPFTASSHSYDPSDFLEETAEKEPRDAGSKTLIVGHLNLRGITAGSETIDMPRGREVFWPTDTIRKLYPDAICIGGHYHDRQTYDGVRIVGSLARLTHGESDNDVGFLEVEI